MIFNPFTDKKFAQFQLESGKASKVIPLDQNNFAYVFPLFKKYNLLYATKFSKKLNQIAKFENAIYTLIESYSPLKHSTENPLKQIVPRHTIILELDKTPDELLAKMHPKGRYNIKLAMKKSLEIKESKNIEDFYQILKTTASRDGFSINSLEYYQKFFKLLPKTKLFIAYYQNQPIAGVLNAYFNKTAIYYYGASSNEHRNLMAPYLLQWHAILDAKQNKYTHYDFLGIADPKNPKDPLQGVTYFKQKFGGHHQIWPASQIIINKPVLYCALKLRKLLKRISI